MKFNENTTCVTLCDPCVTKCNKKRCGLCKNIIEGSSLKINCKTFLVRENLNCIVKNILYVRYVTIEMSTTMAGQVTS